MQKALTKSSMIRINPESHEMLRQLSQQTGESMQALLSQAVEGLRRQQFFKEVNQAYAKLKENPKEWQASQDEISEWDETLLDGLESEGIKHA